MEEKLVEIKQVSEREIWIGENRLYLGEDNIPYVTSVAEIDEKIATVLREAGAIFKNMVTEKSYILGNLNTLINTLINTLNTLINTLIKEECTYQRQEKHGEK